MDRKNDKVQPDAAAIRKGVAFQRGVYAFCRAVIGPFVTLSLHFRYKPSELRSRTFLALGNHTQNLDPALLVIATHKHMRFVANAAITRGFVGLIMNNFFGVIPREKGASGDEVMAKIEANLKAGVPVGMFPEGNRCWDGETEFISPRTARLAKESGAALVTYRFTGGYLLRPRWADYKRKGPMYGELVHEYSPEELASMTEEEVYAAICRDLHVNAYEEQKRSGVLYPGKNLAEGMQYAAYLCPLCHGIGTITTSGDDIRCTCGLHAVYLPDGSFGKGVADGSCVADGSASGNSGAFGGGDKSLPFENLAQWNAWQKRWMQEHGEELKAQKDAPIASDEGFSVKLVDGTNSRMLSSDAKMSLYGDRLELEFDGQKIVHKIEEINGFGTALKSSVYFTCGSLHYQLVSSKPVSLLKYYALWRSLSGRPYL